VVRGHLWRAMAASAAASARRTTPSVGRGSAAPAMPARRTAAWTALTGPVYRAIASGTAPAPDGFLAGSACRSRSVTRGPHRGRGSGRHNTTPSRLTPHEASTMAPSEAQHGWIHRKRARSGFPGSRGSRRSGRGIAITTRRILPDTSMRWWGARWHAGHRRPPRQGIPRGSP
jgi:hypothetical protein